MHAPSLRLASVLSLGILIVAAAAVGCNGGIGEGGDGGDGGDGGAQTGGGGPTGGGSNPTGGGNDATGGGTQTGGGGPTGGGSDPTGGGDAQLCVDTINDYRATLGLPPYARWTDSEACADGQALSDGESGQAHGAFGQCGEFAQNECPGWGGPPEQMIGDCLALMWAEGPGEDFPTHGHYINMSSTSYTMVACGFHTFPDGSVWAVQDFR